MQPAWTSQLRASCKASSVTRLDTLLHLSGTSPLPRPSLQLPDQLGLFQPLFGRGQRLPGGVCAAKGCAVAAVGGEWAVWQIGSWPDEGPGGVVVREGEGAVAAIGGEWTVWRIGSWPDEGPGGVVVQEGEGAVAAVGGAWTVWRIGSWADEGPGGVVEREGEGAVAAAWW
eukprot:361446-Chlamydomonas_euryale.AAC.2